MFERIAWALVFYAGPIALFISLLLAFARDSRVILAGLAANAISRVIITIWSIARPEAQLTPVAPGWRIASAVIWSSLALISL